MAINKKIIEKFKEKTGEDSSILIALISLLVYEDSSPGHFKNQYAEILENSLKENSENEN